MENSLFDGPAVNTVHFDRIPVTYSCARGEKALMNSMLALRFPCDGPVYSSLKGLNAFCVLRLRNQRHLLRTSVLSFKPACRRYVAKDIYCVHDYGLEAHVLLRLCNHRHCITSM